MIQNTSLISLLCSLLLEVLLVGAVSCCTSLSLFSPSAWHCPCSVLILVLMPHLLLPSPGILVLLSSFSKDIAPGPRTALGLPCPRYCVFPPSLQTKAQHQSGNDAAGFLQGRKTWCTCFCYHFMASVFHCSPFVPFLICPIIDLPPLSPAMEAPPCSPACLQSLLLPSLHSMPKEGSGGWFLLMAAKSIPAAQAASSIDPLTVTRNPASPALQEEI